MKKEISSEMKKFIIEECKQNTLNKKNSTDFKNVIKLIAKELSEGKSITTVVQGQLVSISLKNGIPNITNR